MRVALIGAGGIAAAHADNLRRLDDVEIVAVAARSEERASPLAGSLGARPYGDWRALLEREALDAAVICVTPASHGALEHALIDRRIPFLVEKPLAVDWETAAEVAARVAAADLVTSVGYHWRYHRTVERARQALAGRPAALVQGYYLTRTPAPAWWSREAESGGQLIEQATHMLDLARYLVGEAETVFAATARHQRPDHPAQDVDQVSAALVRFAGGAIGTFAATCLLAATHRVGLHLFAEGLAIEIGLHGVAIDDGGTRTEVAADGEAMAREAGAFVDAVRGGDPAGIRSTYADALRTHRLTTRAVESARRGAALPAGQVRG
jgi:predicted dehydrogenase